MIVGFCVAYSFKLICVKPINSKPEIMQENVLQSHKLTVVSQDKGGERRLKEEDNDK